LGRSLFIGNAGDSSPYALLKSQSSPPCAQIGAPIRQTTISALVPGAALNRNHHRDKQWRGSQFVSQYPTKASAWRAAKPLRDAIENNVRIANSASTVSILIEQYRAERMPQRYTTRRSYDAWFRNHIIPRWGNCVLVELQARVVELWLDSLSLSGRSKSSLRGLLSALWDYAQWRGDVSIQRNPMELVAIKGASRRIHKPHILTAEEFQKLLEHLREPFRTIALVSVCFGLRIYSRSLDRSKKDPFLRNPKIATTTSRALNSFRVADNPPGTAPNLLRRVYGWSFVSNPHC